LYKSVYCPLVTPRPRATVERSDIWSSLIAIPYKTRAKHGPDNVENVHTLWIWEKRTRI